MSPDDTTGETTYPFEWRTGPRDLAKIPNQSVFIVGFKITVSEQLLSLKRVTVEVDHSDHPSAPKNVGYATSLANPPPWTTLESTYSSEAATQHEEAIEPTLEHNPFEDKQEHVKVNHVSQMPQV